MGSVEVWLKYMHIVQESGDILKNHSKSNQLMKMNGMQSGTQDIAYQYLTHLFATLGHG